MKPTKLINAAIVLFLMAIVCAAILAATLSGGE